MSLLRKLESRKWRRLSVVKMRPPFTPHLVRELRNLECLDYYCSSNKKKKKKREKSKQWVGVGL